MSRVLTPAHASKESSNLEIATFLKTTRVKLGLSQDEVSRLVGFKSVQYLSNIERALCPPPAHILAPLAKIYGIKVEKIAEIMVRRYEKTLHDAIATQRRIRQKTKPLVVAPKKKTKKKAA